jgi:glycosyltransferase involved in cell wall biosynthesis
MGVFRCSVVIPIIPKHFVYLGKLLEELNTQSLYLGEIHICASSLNEASLQTLRSIVDKSDLQSIIKIHPNFESQTAGQNRNRGWDESKFEIVAFLDADDVYHPRRFEILTDVMQRNNVDAVVHDYYRLAPRVLFRVQRYDKQDLILTPQLLETNRAKLEKSLPPGNLYMGESNVLLPAELSKKYKIHHGHLTVRKNIPLRYTNRKLGEDGELAISILRNKHKLIYLPLKLSIYDRFNLSNVCMSFKGHIIVKSSEIYRLFFRKIT